MPLPSFAAATDAAAAAPCSVASPPTASSSPQIFNTYLATCLKLRLTSSSVRTLLPFSRRLKARSFLAPVFFRSPTPLPIDMGSNGVLLGKEPDLVLSSSYEAAMKALSSLIGGRKNNVKPPKGKLNAMLDYLKIIGVENLIQLNIIHIGGTKGKGSTCTFSEAILRECGFRTGLFTSPHLMDVRERFRINGLDISEDKFLYYFWDCWNILKENVDQNLPMPPLFQFLTVLAFKIFVSEKVDVAVIEVGLGGRLDSTNVVQEPVVCGITSIGMDHMEILGDTIGKIATSKSGIFKPNVPAFTVLQHPDAKLALEERASELMIPLTIVPPLDPKMMRGLTLGLAGDHQFINAGLAVALCINWLQRTEHGELVPQGYPIEELPEAFLRGLSTTSLGGRAQTFIEKNQNSGDLVFYLDGAHSPESMEVCARWFSNTVKEPVRSLTKVMNDHVISSFHNNKHSNEFTRSTMKVLLFNCMEKRDPQLLLPPLINICASNGVHFSKVIFVPSMSVYHRVDSGSSIVVPDSPANLSWQFILQRTWEKLIHEKDFVNGNGSSKQQLDKSLVHEFHTREAMEKCGDVLNDLSCSAVIPSLPLAIKCLRDYVKENPTLSLQVLVTGSLHLVGDVLKLLKK
ncbi:folylpolyglutamate synthase-like isoform X1 [Zingiber officinale]|uniref:folylpolyglutamate synthase-like isoform X1 n=2 Tax=Zingiber officinale TaxID=94328 RepID=UPI001C4C8709|nr:folylpolyglutamate synthase-like isoform X1 [Zingiber officinale]